MATTCFVSLCMALKTVPNDPVPSFSMRVYWLAGFELGIGYGSRRAARGRSGEEGGDLESLGCGEADKRRSEFVRFLSFEPGMMGVRARAGDRRERPDEDVLDDV